MTPRSRRTTLPLLALALTAALAATPPASAIYMITPLHLTPSATEAQVGDEVTFEITPSEEHEGATYENARVTIRFGYDPNETADEPQPEGSGSGGSTDSGEATTTDPDAPVSSDDETAGGEAEDPYTYATIATLTLGASSTGTAAWTVPAEVDDHNVFVTVLSESGDTLASAHIAVGDAPPIMWAAMEGAPDDTKVVEDTPPADRDDAGGESADDTGRVVPAAAPVAALAAVAALALLARRR